MPDAPRTALRRALRLLTTPHRWRNAARRLLSLAWTAWKSLTSVRTWRLVARRLLSAPHWPIAGYLAWAGHKSLTTPRTDPVDVLTPVWLSTAWAVALIVGGVLVVIGVATDKGRAESSGHAFHLAGLGLLAASTAMYGGDAWVAIVTLAAVSAIRMHVLTGSREALREAEAIREAGEIAGGNGGHP